MTTDHEVREQVRARYAEAAQAAAAGTAAEGGCCTTTSACCGSTATVRVFGPALDDARQSAGLLSTAVTASLGCRTPTAVAELSEGWPVLGLGSGGGIDVLLSARRVGPTGYA